MGKWANNTLIIKEPFLTHKAWIIRLSVTLIVIFLHEFSGHEITKMLFQLIFNSNKTKIWNDFRKNLS